MCMLNFLSLALSFLYLSIIQLFHDLHYGAYCLSSLANSITACRLPYYQEAGSPGIVAAGTQHILCDLD